MDEPPTSRPKFQWPPKPVDPSVTASPPQDSSFWRDREPTRLAAHERAGSIDLPGATGVRRWVLDIERTWLGLSRAPLVERLQDANWSADEPEAYCPHCGTTCGSFEVGPKGCPACSSRRLGWDRAVRLGSYEGVLREVIHDVKFSAWKSLGRELGRLLGAAAARALDDAGLPGRDAVVVPVPTTLWRRVSRGIDHTGVLARGVAEVVGAPVLPALRRSHRPTQVGTSASRRLRNVRRSMRSMRGVSLQGRVMLVVDDVRTTGATLEECCRAVSELAVEFRPKAIWVVTLGVTPELTPTRAGQTVDPNKARP